MTDKKQINKFKEMARELECNESEDDFQQKLKKVAKARPKNEPSKKSKGGIYINPKSTP